MKENEILDEVIDRYLKGAMTNEEKNAFDSRMAKDPELLREVELHRSIIRAIQNEQLGNIFRKEERSIKKRSIRKLVISIGSFAVAASLLGFFYVGYLNNCESISDRYYQSYTYTPLPSRGEEITPLTKSDSVFFDALRNLDNGHKKLAINQLETLYDSSSEMLAATGDAVKWYLALAYLKNGQKKKAKILLHELAVKDNGDYKNKATNILKEL